MNCGECGKALLENAQFCSACGRRVIPDRIEPVLHPRRAKELPAPPPRTWRTVEHVKPPQAPSFARRLSQAIAAWPHAPHAAVAFGCVLAVAIYFSAAHDEAVANKAGAARIAAATGARPTTSQPAAAGALKFSAKQALQGLYGNYDPVLDGAFWTVTGAPKRWNEWNGRTVLIRPLVSRSDEAATRHMLVTHTVEVRNGMVVKQGAGCRHCKSLIGGVLFERQGDEWKLVSDQRFLGVEGEFGAPPKVAVAFPAKSGVELRIEPSSLVQVAEEPAAPVVMSAGKKAQGVLTRPRARSVEPRSADARPAEPRSDSPFPTAAAGP